MNSISQDQNNQNQLERLAAQRELYSAAKKIQIMQFFLTVVVSVILSICALVYEELAVFAAIFGVAVFVIDISILEPSIQSRKIKAAKIQELFDCDILKLPKSPLKVVDDITVEEVLTYYNAHAKIANNVEKIKDWYPTEVAQLPLTTARIICQRANCYWDSKLREKYSDFLKYMSIVVFASIIIGGLIANLKIIEVTLIASGLIPFFQTCIKQCNDNREAANRLNQLVSYATKIWEETLSGNNSDTYLTENCRRLQDEIFEHRSKSPLIFDFIYNYFRDDDEKLMNRSTQLLISDALEKHKLNNIR